MNCAGGNINETMTVTDLSIAIRVSPKPHVPLGAWTMKNYPVAGVFVSYTLGRLEDCYVQS